MNDGDKQEADQLLQVIREAVTKLGEHFDSVQIFANKHISNDAGTVRWQQGTGNWFARYGHVKTWIVATEAETFKESTPPDPDL